MPFYWFALDVNNQRWVLGVLGPIIPYEFFRGNDLMQVGMATQDEIMARFDVFMLEMQLLYKDVDAGMTRQ